MRIVRPTWTTAAAGGEKTGESAFHVSLAHQCLRQLVLKLFDRYMHRILRFHGCYSLGILDLQLVQLPIVRFHPLLHLLPHRLKCFPSLRLLLTLGFAYCLFRLKFNKLLIHLLPLDLELMCLLLCLFLRLKSRLHRSDLRLQCERCSVAGVQRQVFNSVQLRCLSLGFPLPFCSSL